jgi:hypothetical protein
MRGKHLRVLAIFTLALTYGCVTVGGSSASVARRAVAGTFGGWIEVEGTEVEGILELRVEDRSVLASLTSNQFGVSALGEGRFRGGSLELTLAYELDCEGELRMRGVLSDDGQFFTGSLVAADCTGNAEGRFSFQRVPSR